MYHVYNHRQPIGNITESPRTDLGFAQSPQTNQGITASQGLGLAVAGTRLFSTGRQLVNTAVNASGNIKTQQNFRRLGAGVAFAYEVEAFGIVGALGIESLNLVADTASNYIDTREDRINQEYTRQLNGGAIDDFVGRGQRYD